MILDNLDEDQLLRASSVPDLNKGGPIVGRLGRNASAKPLLEYIPRCQPNGSVIMTSRSREVALRIVSHKDIIEVKPMEESEALQLLRRKLDQPTETQTHEARQLVEALELMPLAIVQAASYIRNRMPRFTVSQYLSDLQGSDFQATRLLRKEEPDHIYRDWEAKNSILLTWEISFNHIRKIRKSAANLLSLMSFFDRQGIPENILRFRDEKQPWLSKLCQSLLLTTQKGQISYRDPDSTDDNSFRSFDANKNTALHESQHEFDDDVQTLRNYSFISINQSTRSFDMHRLVQLATRKWLESREESEWWKGKFIQSLTENCPRGDYENWSTCQALFPHIKSAFSQKPTRKDSILQWTSLLYKGAWYASQTGRFSDARKMGLESMKEREKLLGLKNKFTLASKSMLARAHWLEGDWEEAEKLYTQVFQCRKNKLGKNDASLLTSMANLASTYWNLGRWQEAERLFTQVMMIRELEFGEDHPLTLTAMSNLAVTYACQGRLEEAEELELRVMKGRQAKLGKSHPSTLTSMSNLALTYGDQGRWKEAESLFIQVIKMSNAILGEDHPSTLTSMANLGMIYGHQGREEEAEKLGVQVMEIRKRKLGEHHPSTLTSIANLVSLKRPQLRAVSCQTENPAGV